MQKINILNFDQITSHADRQPAQFAQLAPERAGLQGEHYFHEPARLRTLHDASGRFRAPQDASGRLRTPHEA